MNICTFCNALLFSQCLILSLENVCVCVCVCVYECRVFPNRALANRKAWKKIKKYRVIPMWLNLLHIKERNQLHRTAERSVVVSLTVQGPGCRATCCFQVALCNSWGAGFNPQCRAELCIILWILHHVYLNAVLVLLSWSTQFQQLFSSRCHMERKSEKEKTCQYYMQTFLSASIAGLTVSSQ